MIILFPAAGGTRPVYHPDLTSGKLIYLDAVTVETTDAAIKNVTANAFDIDTGEASDTYWYIVLPRCSGCIGLGTYIGNGNADGPYVVADDGAVGIRPALLFMKSSTTEQNWVAFDEARNAYNPADAELRPDTTDVETVAAARAMDFTANGFKVRATSGNENASGATFVYLALAAFPFGGSGVAQGRAR